MTTATLHTGRIVSQPNGSYCAVMDAPDGGVAITGPAKDSKGEAHRALAKKRKRIHEGGAE